MSDRVVRPVPIEQTRGLRQALLRPHQTVEEMALDERPGVFAAGAFDGDELVAVGLVARDGEPGAWRVRGMVTVPEARGRGFGTAVLRALVEHASGQGANLIWCSARTPARAFYEQAGLRVVSDEFELPQIGPHLKMELRLDDREATSTVPRS